MIKNQNFYMFFVAGLLIGQSCFAVDYLDVEDEALLKGDNVVEVATENEDIDIKKSVPSRGEALHAVAVPDEINEQALKYKNEVVLDVKNGTPRSFEYPIGKERKEREEWRFQWYDIDAMQAYKKQEVDTSAEEKRAEYIRKVNDCNESLQNQLGIEIAMLEEGNRYNNAAYLSESLQNMGLCYRDVGYDIIDHLYGGNEDKSEQFEEDIKQFHVDSSDPSFNAKYCDDFCSVQAIAQMQLEKFTDFRIYLTKMIKEAPMIDIDEEIEEDVGEEGTEVQEFEELLDDNVESKDDGIYIRESDLPLIDEDI